MFHLINECFHSSLDWVLCVCDLNRNWMMSNNIGYWNEIRGSLQCICANAMYAHAHDCVCDASRNELKEKEMCIQKTKHNQQP